MAKNIKQEELDELDMEYPPLPLETVLGTSHPTAVDKGQWLKLYKLAQSFNEQKPEM